ncbi:mitogen-activated protein kinase 14 isoform X2 [Oryza sativa Japonica Group]|uniref:mitogen-activated protein kinase 14 isoform X2 n=1 Tax=Oryza sativa subsp. japonica TaxID=39947 RepID=UPI000E1B64E5|nr:mitogen-activated protein kinase 14 isoform X2 [Oryza sativa Japonica Group]
MVQTELFAANVFHRDLKPKNILANADCKLKICDFGLARVAFSDTPTAIFWTDYIATRWYRAPELCGSFFSKYTPAIDIWSIGCIFAELLTGKPLFPGKNVVHQLDIITDLLGTPSPETISRIRNEKARRYLNSMRRKKPIPFTQKFPNADPLAMRLLERMLAFDPKDRPSAEEALADPYFKNIANVDREPSAQPITKLEFEFERRRITKEDIRELIYREILEYHPKMLREFLEGTESTGFMYPSAVDHFKKQFAYLEEHYAKGSTAAPPERQHNSLPRPCVVYSDNRPQSTASVTEDLSRCLIRDNNLKSQDSASVGASRIPQGAAARPGKAVGSVLRYGNCSTSAAEQQYEQRRVVRNPAIAPNSSVPLGSSYPRRNQTCKSETGDVERIDSSQTGPPKPYVANKLPATVDGRSGHW